MARRRHRRKTGGRPTKLTPAVQARIVEALRGGNYLDTAVACAGIHQGTFHRWMQRPERLFREFREAVERAKAEAEASLVGTIEKASHDTWTAAAWILERTRPAKFALHVRHLAEQELNAALDDLERELAPAEFQKVARVLAERARREAGALGAGVGDGQPSGPATTA